MKKFTLFRRLVFNRISTRMEILIEIVLTLLKGKVSNMINYGLQRKFSLILFRVNIFSHSISSYVVKLSSMLSLSYSGRSCWRFEIIVKKPLWIYNTLYENDTCENQWHNRKPRINTVMSVKTLVKVRVRISNRVNPNNRTSAGVILWGEFSGGIHRGNCLVGKFT